MFFQENRELQYLQSNYTRLTVRQREESREREIALQLRSIGHILRLVLSRLLQEKLLGQRRGDQKRRRWSLRVSE